MKIIDPFDLLDKTVPAKGKKNKRHGERFQQLQDFDARCLYCWHIVVM
jgi:hypothetical protein